MMSDDNKFVGVPHGNMPYTYRTKDARKTNAVVRCKFCNKFMSFKKYYKNNWTCYHCGGKR